MISVLLPVKNVEDILAACLDGVTWADEVLLLDGASSDRTLEIAARYPNVRVIQHPSSDIRVVVAEGEALARNPWILWICADEVVTPELGREVLDACAAAGPEIAGFWVPTRDFMYGVEWGQGAAWGRVWRKGRAKFEFKRMHEMPRISGEMGTLKHHFWNVNNPNIRTHIPKLLRYEYVDARNATEEQCARVNGSFWYQLARFCYFAVGAYWAKRHLGFPATANAMCVAFGHLLRHLLLVEELRIRRGETKRSTHGW